MWRCNVKGNMQKVWESHYAKRWRAPWTKAGSAWQVQYSHKMRNARAFSSKGLADILYGHTAAVTAISLLPASNILATGNSLQVLLLLLAFLLSNDKFALS